MKTHSPELRLYYAPFYAIQNHAIVHYRVPLLQKHATSTSTPTLNHMPKTDQQINQGRQQMLSSLRVSSPSPTLSNTDTRIRSHFG